jgi:hypothetical protein
MGTYYVKGEEADNSNEIEADMGLD